MKSPLILLVLVLVSSGCVSEFSFEQGMGELELIEGKYLDDTGSAIKGSINDLVAELESFKTRLDGYNEREDIRALSIFTDFKINYYLFLNELEDLSSVSQEATCSNPEAAGELVDSAGSVSYYSENIADDIQELVEDYGQYMDNETLSDMTELRDYVRDSAELMAQLINSRVESLSNCSGG